MSFEVFWASGSPYAWRVLLALELKGQSYESRLLEFSKGDLRTPEFKQISPREKVPAIRDGDYTLYESLAILNYIDRKWPTPPIFGQTPEACGRIHRLVMEYTVYMDDAVENFILPLYFGKATEKAEQLKQAAATIKKELSYFETTLSEHSWFVGDSPSAADIVLYPALASIQRAASKEAAVPFEFGLLPIAQHYPRLGRWMARVEKLPGFERTYPPHWK